MYERTSRKTLPLAGGGPRTACERELWYELAPAEARRRHSGRSSAPSPYYGPGVLLERSSGEIIDHGIGAFQHGKGSPEELEELWPVLAEPELERRHRARQEPVAAASWRSYYWSLAGLGALSAGLGAGASLQDESPTAAALIGVSGLALGLLATVGAMAALPSPAELQQHEVRRWLLQPPGDDLAAAARGVERANQRRRRACSEQPPATTK